MDELTQVRGLRSDAPRPDRGRLAPGRQKLMDVAQRGGRARRLRTDWRLATVGAVAALTVTALLGSRLWGGDQVKPGAQPVVTVQLGDAKDVLEHAADVVAGQHAPTPHAGQWVYELTKEANRTDEETPVSEHSHWAKYADPTFENGKMGDDYSPRKRYQFLADLPDDPEAVKKKARVFYPSGNETQAQHDLRALTILAQSYPAPPKGLAAVYRAMATIPGLKAANTTDLLGRDTIDVYLPQKSAGAYPLRHDFLIDSTTYAYVGTRAIAQSDNHDKGGKFGDSWKKGDVIIDLARKQIALVDKNGERP